MTASITHKMLDRLPNEILHLVCRELATTPDLIHAIKAQESKQHLDQWKALARLCKVSRQMRHVAEPLLYQNYAKPDSASNPVAHYSFRKYLTTVLKRPELLQYVRSFYIGSWRHYAEEDLQYAAKSRFAACTARVCDTHFSPELHRLYDRYAKTAVLGEAWKEALDAGEEVAEIALLMSLTPNLERIEFSMPWLDLESDTAPQYFWPKLLVESEGWNPYSHFHRLEAITAHKRNLKPGMNRDVEFGYEIDSLLPFIGLPKLRIFWVEGDDSGLYPTRLEKYPLNNQESHLTDLILIPSSIHPTKLLQILKRCTKLEAFYADLQEEDNFVPNFSWNTIAQALSGSQSTLKELDLSCDLRSQLATEADTEAELTCVSIGSLRKFTSLETLHVLQTTLLGFENMANELELAVPAPPFDEILPSSLRSLMIEMCTLTIVPYLEGLLVKVEEKFPDFGELQLSEIDYRELDVEEYPLDQREALIEGMKVRLERLKEGFIQAGIKWIQ
ncbi:hypothetical protein D6D01_07097 [Aureobasidium pullulans]|uniref:Leucine-rich repeat domain-containing protein n=1 Tax=Aureobasidium pullulans TaxID=5580 RepID=A0A4S9KSG8_AURPU|nr:hypothetical protein D6D01_07097 [Aureobasidium pullulans]